MNDYPQEVLKILDKEIRTQGKKFVENGRYVFRLERNGTSFEVDAIFYSTGKRISIDKLCVGTIIEL